MLARVPVCQYQTPPSSVFSPTHTTLMPGGGFQEVVQVRLFQKWVLPVGSRSWTHSADSRTGFSSSFSSCALWCSSSFFSCTGSSSELTTP